MDLKQVASKGVVRRNDFLSVIRRTVKVGCIAGEYIEFAGRQTAGFGTMDVSWTLAVQPAPWDNS